VNKNKSVRATQKAQLVLVFAALLTLTWLALLFWVSAGIVELI
jgi:hypothetical protein